MLDKRIGIPMNYDDLTECSDLRYDIIHFSEHDGICILNGMIPISVDAVSFSYESDEDIEIHDEHDNVLGVLCICKSITDINIVSLTEARYIAYIHEVDKNTFEQRLPYNVRCCTAHNRIGEYVISNDDEGFVVEFAEPLLREVLCQIFSE